MPPTTATAPPETPILDTEIRAAEIRLLASPESSRLAAEWAATFAPVGGVYDDGDWDGDEDARPHDGCGA